MASPLDAPHAQSCAAAESVLVEVFGWLGCVAAWMLFISPIPTMRKIRRRGYVGDFSSIPYLISMLQCGLWSVYALPPVTPCKLQPLVTNGVGFCLEIAYCIFMIYFSIGRAQRILMVRFAVMLAALGAFSAMGVKLVPYLTRPDGLKWPDKAASTMTNALGLTCTVLNVGMYAAPLAAVGTVIKKRSVQSMPLSLTLCTGFCSMCWTIYALLVADDFILIPNLAGLGLFGLQLLVYRCYAPFCSCSEAHRDSADDDVSPPKRHSHTRGDALLGDQDAEVATTGAQGHEALVSPVADYESAIIPPRSTSPK